MTLTQIGALALSVVCLVYFLFRRVKNSKSDERRKIEQFENERRKRAIEAIRGRSKNSAKLIDYDEYVLSFKEKLVTFIVVGICLFIVGYLFYDNIIISLLMVPLSIFTFKFRARQLRDKRKDELSMQFKEAAASLSSALAAGQSIENSFRSALKDLLLLYPDSDTYIIKEFSVINRRIENGENVETAFSDFANRTDIDDIQNFSDVFITCKRSGGDLVEVIKRTVDIINEKIEIQQDIKVLISQKKLESRIIAIVPILLIAMLKFTSKDFIAPLYDFGTPGPIVATVALITIVVSIFISNWIMKIEV